MREDIKIIINAIQDINTGFISEKIQRAFLDQQELQLLRHILKAISGNPKDKFQKYGWNFSNALY